MGLGGKRGVRAVLSMAGLLMLAGCNAEYTVKVHNDGARPVSVRLMQDQVVSDPVALASATVPAGGQAKLGPVKATVTDDVVLEVGTGEMGIPPAKQRVYPGTSEFRVGGGGSADWGPASITEVGK